MVKEAMICKDCSGYQISLQKTPKSLHATTAKIGTVTSDRRPVTTVDTVYCILLCLEA
jgi:hypothetical protein